jgi:rhamnosyltransferase
MNGDGLDRARIGAVVVTYRPDDGLASRLAPIARHVDAVVIVDNDSGDATLRRLREIRTGSTVDVIANRDNRGVAAALNQGVDWARARGYAWVLTLDQDTIPTDGLVPTLAAVYEDARATKRVAVIGANYVDDEPGGDCDRGRAGGDAGRGWIETPTVLTSGSALSLRAFEAIGPFRDDLFIDHVDHEYCLRARARGFSVILARAPLMIHPIGAVTTHRLLGQALRTHNHAVPRWYFKTRNLAVVVRAYGRREPRWALAASAWHLRTTVTMAMFEAQRMAKLREVAVGAWDGLRGRLGGYRGAAIPGPRALT